MFISPFRRLTSAGTLIVLMLLIFSVWYITNPKRIARLAESLLSNVLGGKVTVKSARLSFSGTLLLSGVELRTEGASTATTGPNLALPIFTADQIEARFDWTSLLSGQLHATQLSAIRPTLYLVEDKDAQRWNYEKLRAQPSGTQSGSGTPSYARPAAPTLPVIVLRDARVQWAEVHNGVFEETAKTIIDGQLTPDAMVPAFYRFQISERAEVTPAPGVPAPEGETRDLPGGASISGTWDVGNNRLTAASQKIPLSDKLMSSLPRQVRQWCSDHNLKGNLSQLRMTFDNDDGLVFAVDLDHVGMHQIITPEPWLAKAREALGAQTQYDIALQNVSGTLTFGVSKPNVKASNLSGDVLGYHFLADGEFRGNSPESPFEFTLRFPHAILGEKYPSFFTAFRGSQDLLQRIAPHGDIDFTISLKRLSWNGPLFNNGVVICHDATMRFAPFPYPLDHVNGEIDFNEQAVTFNDVTARADEMLAHLNGVTGSTKKNRTVDFTVSCDNAVFDDRIGSCLPLKFKPLWEQFSINAKGSFVCHVTRAVDAQTSPDFNVDVYLTDGTGYARTMPYRFTGATGHLFFGVDHTELDHLTLHPADPKATGTVVLNGTIKQSEKAVGDSLRLNPEIKITADLPVDQPLLNLLPVEYTSHLKNITATGRINFDGTLRHATDKLTSDFTLAGLVNWHDGALTLPDQHLQLQKLSALFQFGPGRIDIQNFTATTPENLTLTASGPVDLQNNTGALTVAATGSDVTIPAYVPAILPPSIHDIWAIYQPSGKVAVDATMKIRITNPTQETWFAPPTTQPTAQQSLPITVDTYALKLTAKNARIAPKGWPESIDEITGTILANPDRMTFDTVTAKTGPLLAHFDGTYQLATGAIHLTGSATSSNLVGKWSTKLPATLSKFLDDHHAAGNVDVTLTRLDRSASGKPWEFDGSFSLSKLTATGPNPIAAEQLHILGGGAYSSATGLDFKGTLSGTQIIVTGKTVDAVSSPLVATATDHTIRAADLSGTAAGGALQGSILVRLDNDPRYEANLVLSGASLSKLLLAPNATARERENISEGVVSATLAVQENFGTNPDRTGRGELIVREGKIYNLPLAMGLMQIATLRLPVAKAFDHASMTYYLRNDDVTFEKILLESPGINLAGSGSMSLKDKALNMTFVTTSPNELHIPFFTPILTIFRDNILEINVTGTADTPKINPIPLNAIGTALQNILPRRQSGE